MSAVVVSTRGSTSRYRIEPSRIKDYWVLVRASYAASSGVYGAPRVFLDLREAGETCGKHRVARIMRENEIKALRGYEAPRAIAGRPSIIAPNRLQREFTVERPDHAWVTDITYIRTWLRTAVCLGQFGGQFTYLRESSRDLRKISKLSPEPERSTGC